MNILIIGEFSAFAKHLKSGLLSFGHDIRVVQNGDSFKKIPAAKDDIIYCSSNFHLFGHEMRGSYRIRAPFENFRIKRALTNFFPKRPDVIIVINYSFLSSSFISQIGVPCSLLKEWKNAGAKIIMSCCGGDPATYYSHREWYNKIKIYHKDKDYRYDLLYSISNLVIPTAYSYYKDVVKYASFRGWSLVKISSAIPLPITNMQNSVNSTVKEKIVVFHGIIDELRKGSRYFIEAMDRLQNDFPNKVICIVKGRMPYTQYLQLMETVDILCDQVYGDGWGVNASIGLMAGKVVLAPFSKENENHLSIGHIPIIPVAPDAQLIYERLRALIMDSNLVCEIKRESRAFALNNLESKVIAKRYLDLLINNE